MQTHKVTQEQVLIHFAHVLFRLRKEERKSTYFYNFKSCSLTSLTVLRFAKYASHSLFTLASPFGSAENHFRELVRRGVLYVIRTLYNQSSNITYLLCTYYNIFVSLIFWPEKNTVISMQYYSVFILFLAHSKDFCFSSDCCGFSFCFAYC